MNTYQSIHDLICLNTNVNTKCNTNSTIKAEQCWSGCILSACFKNALCNVQTIIYTNMQTLHYLSSHVGLHVDVNKSASGKEL